MRAVQMRRAPPARRVRLRPSAPARRPVLPSRRQRHPPLTFAVRSFAAPPQSPALLLATRRQSTAALRRSSTVSRGASAASLGRLTRPCSSQEVPAWGAAGLGGEAALDGNATARRMAMRASNACVGMSEARSVTELVARPSAHLELMRCLATRVGGRLFAQRTSHSKQSPRDDVPRSLPGTSHAPPMHLPGTSQSPEEESAARVRCYVRSAGGRVVTCI